MNEPLDLELIAEIIGSYCPAHETGVDPQMIAEAVLDEIMPEVERLRAELARRDQQITAVRETLDGLSSRYTVAPQNFPRIFGVWYTDLRAALDGTP